MKKLFFFFMILTIFCFADIRNSVSCYLYELQGDNLILVGKYDKPVVAKNINQMVLILDKGKEPTQEQLEALKKNIKTRLNPPITDRTNEDTDILILKKIIKEIVDKTGIQLTEEEKSIIERMNK